MGKIIETRKLYKKTIREVAENIDKWLLFLNSASYHFKYSFSDKILIYAQNPDATACAEMEIWNKKLKRWINKNPKVIFVNENKENSLYPYRMVFDVSETYNYKNTPYKLWEVKKEYEDEIIETLEGNFGEISQKDTLAQAIRYCAYNMVVDNAQDYLISIENHKIGTELQNRSIEEIKSAFIPTLWASVSYMMMKRCNINPEKEINKLEFSAISDFSDENIITIFGTATSDIAGQGLREIARTVNNLQKEEKNKNHTFVKRQNIDYANDGKDIEGGIENGENKIHQAGQLYDTQYNVRKGETANRQIRTEKVEISKNTQEGRIYDTLERQETSTAFDRNTGNSDQKNRVDSESNEREHEHNRRIENQKSNGVGRTDEQYSTDSGTDSNARNNLNLKEQKDKKESEKDSFFDEKKYHFMVGDIIYLGEREYTIVEINNGMLKMYDNYFPIEQITVLVDNIIKRVAENPLNDYLKERDIPEVEENSFNKWLDTFIAEKGIELKDTFSLEGDDNFHIFEVGNVIENIKMASPEEQIQIKDMLVKIDFNNGSVLDYLQHLAKALVKNYEKGQEGESKVEEIKEDISEQKDVQEKIIKRDRNIEYFDLHPEISAEERNNFKICDTQLGIGSDREKYKNNIEAIKVLKLCEKQNRYATISEQEILSKYVGWGGLRSVFEERNNSWSDEYCELKSILTEEEYESARASSITAYYTQPIIIKNIYQVLQNMGLKQGNILEPSCRSWKFYGNVTKWVG